MPASQPKSQGSGKTRLYKPDPKPLSNQPDPTGWENKFNDQMGMTKELEEAGETGSSAAGEKED